LPCKALRELQQDDKWGKPKKQSGTQEIAHRNPVLAPHVSFGSRVVFFRPHGVSTAIPFQSLGGRPSTLLGAYIGSPTIIWIIYKLYGAPTNSLSLR
jgi:hypothetical protein